MRGRVLEGDLDILRKQRNQGLSDGITKHKLWPYDQDLDHGVSSHAVKHDQ